MSAQQGGMLGKGSEGIRWGRIADTIKGGYDKYSEFKGKFEEYKDYYERVNSVIDEETREGAIVKESWNAMLKLLGRIFGQSVGRHPIVQYHQVHIEALASAINQFNKVERMWTVREKAKAATRTFEKESLKFSLEYERKWRKVVGEIDAVLDDCKWGSFIRQYDRPGAPISEDELASIQDFVGYMTRLVEPKIAEYHVVYGEVTEKWVALLTVADRIAKLFIEYELKVEELIKGRSMEQIGGYFEKIGAEHRQKPALPKKELDQAIGRTTACWRKWFYWRDYYKLPDLFLRGLPEQPGEQQELIEQEGPPSE